MDDIARKTKCILVGGGSQKRIQLTLSNSNPKGEGFLIRIIESLSYSNFQTWRVKIRIREIKADKENKCKVVVVGKVVNKNDGLGMKVPSRLIFTAEEKYINILKERLPKML